MTSRAVRYLLLTLFVGSFAAAGYVTWDEERQAQALAAAARAFDDEAVAASRLLLDLRHAQSGYVAAGQGDEFWSGRADALFASAREALSRLQGLAQAETSSRAVAEAGAAFDDFQQMDRRARSYVRNGQRLLASDLVFSDGLERIDLAVAALDRARSAEDDRVEAGHDEHRRAQLLALAAASGAGLFVVMLLLPLPRRDGAAVTLPASSPTPAAERIALRDSLPLNPKPVPAPPIAEPTPAPAPEPVPLAAPPPSRQDVPDVRLPAIAALCTELAQVVDTQALPPALARAAAILRAHGIVIWICDPDGRELTAVLAHGYPAQLVARLGTIARDEENVTAAAFRTGLVQIVRPSDGVNGAVAAPLVTPGGPVGVMAAEVSPASGDGESLRAAASIIAAQLATLVGAPVSRTAAGASGA